MDGELILLVGALLCVLSFPSWLAAFVDGRRPWVALGLLPLGLGLVAWGFILLPGPFVITDTPNMVYRVIARHLL